MAIGSDYALLQLSLFTFSGTGDHNLQSNVVTRRLAHSESFSQWDSYGYDFSKPFILVCQPPADGSDQNWGNTKPYPADTVGFINQLTEDGLWDPTTKKPILPKGMIFFQFSNFTLANWNLDGDFTAVIKDFGAGNEYNGLNQIAKQMGDSQKNVHLAYTLAVGTNKANVFEQADIGRYPNASINLEYHIQYNGGKDFTSYLQENFSHSY